MFTASFGPPPSLQPPQLPAARPLEVSPTALIIKAILGNAVGIDCSEDELLEEMRHAVAGCLGEGPNMRQRARALLREMGCDTITLEDVERRPVLAWRQAAPKKISHSCRC